MDEIMEDGNLIDRVRILLQRDMQHYQVVYHFLNDSSIITSIFYNLNPIKTI